MTTEEALQFLSSHQPLPPTREIGESVLEKFDDIRKHFAVNIDNRCVPLLLNAFGDGDGHGVFQLVEDTIMAYPDEVVIPALLNGLQSQHASVREWNAEIVANYPRPEFVVPLTNLLRNGGVDEQMAAVTALELIGTSEAKEQLVKALETDIHDDVKDTIRQALDRSN